eukprot:8486963-Pyramimonas_sp.AAC.1
MVRRVDSWSDVWIHGPACGFMVRRVDSWSDMWIYGVDWLHSLDLDVEIEKTNALMMGPTGS